MAFNKILIANRGEVAVRVIRAAHSLGYETVAVYSSADADAEHVNMADQAVCIGPPEAGASYLNMEALLSAAALSGADAVHPGYGFLSENKLFAEAVARSGLTWIGPSPHAMAVMGNKSSAKRIVASVGVPIVPGYEGEDQALSTLEAEAMRIGYPVMVKAAMGGGGRGMRLVAGPDGLMPAVVGARSEAMAAFGSGQLLLEKAIVNPRHIEIQVFGDQFGNVIHLGERDCSIQRRHQKVIEEAPSPALDAALRAKIGAAAVAAAKAVAYVGAGTVEFLLDDVDNFYFIEMNTRLQVEHPVTEMITGVDLVAWQLLIASGAPLPLMQEEVALSGHAIEVRLYAEAPANGFMPSIGRIHFWQPPSGTNVRVDHNLQAGQAITPYYDAMIAKIITSGPNRASARRRMRRALLQTVVLGVETNRAFLLDAIDHSTFRQGEATTGFVEAAGLTSATSAEIGLEPLAALILYQLASRQAQPALRQWGSLSTTFCFDAANRQRLVTVLPQRTGGYLIDSAEYRIVALAEHHVRYEQDGLQQTAAFALAPDGELWVQAGRQTGRFIDYLLSEAESADAAASGNIVAPMPGAVLRIAVTAGDRVVKGQPLLIIEAMKMEHTIAAPFDGIVEQVFVRHGQQMKPKQPLLQIKSRGC